MSDQINVEVTIKDGKVIFNEEMMLAMWAPSRLLPHSVNGQFQFEVDGEHIGIVDLLCYLDEVNQGLRDQGPEAIVEAVLGLIGAVYIGDESDVLVGKVLDIYGIEFEGRAGIVFRTVVLSNQKDSAEIQKIREIGKLSFPVPQPE
ncbi:hypothetical protein CIG75_16105 [Tumebacillus algifaecis]|uniref:Uncharacterized protein n=1 Tax=Tumebacillus algifaecis TaxID=1214604 RepID=A0A223D3Y7_9BACL|nr:hypothetical protein [Tumebacillus algifaecis]ASS76319.1 hypothetical protein CIG75_16105 [Tumebacillus algifaecis]